MWGVQGVETRHSRRIGGGRTKGRRWEFYSRKKKEKWGGGGVNQKWLTQLVIQFNLAKAMLNCEHSMKLNQADKFRHVDCEDQGNWTQSIAKPLRQNVCSNNM